jgi:2-amino-4-hydroxy-6-hydroxymethyldihydropteridine diphosphokinase
MCPENATVFICLGTNIGDRGQNLAQALQHLKAYIAIEAASSVYETQPVGFDDQPWFLNMVVKGATALSPRGLLAGLWSIEQSMGRQRTIKQGPRIIDLDILFYSDKIINEEGLIIPHPEIQSRGFVLVPLNEIAPEFIHPGLAQNIRSLFADLRQDKQVHIWTQQR